MTTEKSVALTTNKFTEVSRTLDSTVLSVIGQKNLEGFDRAFSIATAIGKLDELLTHEYMAPIMKMQGNKLGFLTDKDKSGGYDEKTVKKCLIEAVLWGLQPYGNQFNIIAGNMYPTKEGCGYKLNSIEGLDYQVVCSIPKLNPEKTGAAVDVTVTWAVDKGEKQTQIVPFPIKMDAYTSVDAVIGKATRKGRAWLISRITGIEVTDADIADGDFEDVTGKENSVADKKAQLRESQTTNAKTTLL